MEREAKYMAFIYTVSKPNYNEKTLLPGTAVHYQAGTVAGGDFKEGNGIVVLCTPLLLEIDLFELHLKVFERIVVPIEDFVASKIRLQVLTIEDGVGNEPTGSIPTDIYPPEEVDSLRAEHTDTSITFYWNNPSADFAYTKVLRDNVIVANNLLGSTLVESALTPGTMYFYKFVTVDPLGNESPGQFISIVMNAAGDKTINLVIASEI